MQVEAPVLMRFRALVSDFRTANAGLQAIDRQLNDRRMALLQLRAEADRWERDAHAPWRHIAEEVKQRLKGFRDRALKLEAEIARLDGDRERAQARRDDASRIVTRCRDFLTERGVARAELENC